MAHPLPPQPRAIVLGASIAGLATARVLSDFFAEVWVLDRDSFPSAPDHRRYVPQSPHAHGLLGGGRNALRMLFPDWIEGLRAYGAPVGPDQPEIAEKVSYIVRGQHAIAAPSWWLGGVGASRVLLEYTLRECVRKLPNVRFFEQTRAIGLCADETGRVCGVQLAGGSDAAGASANLEDRTDADLVVDATGRSSALPEWLVALGHAAPSATVVHSEVQYASCILEAEPDFDPEWLTLLAGDTGASSSRGVVILPIEHGRYHCTFATVASADRIPDEPDAYLAWGRELPSEVVRRALSNLRVASPVRRYRVPSNRFLRYAKLRRHPDGVLALGDAVCAFNPVYGQGMSVAAQSAIALQSQLEREDGAARPGFALRAARAIAAVTEPAWSLAVSEDLRLGCRTEGIYGKALWRATEAYRDRLTRVASIDPEVALALNEVVHLTRPPSVLVSPRIVARVLSARGHATAAVPRTSPTRATRHLFAAPPFVPTL
jgi:2-polyprenyl-6-methoxyphenol hydroxylase-like FAD-dependent oxidoreductase